MAGYTIESEDGRLEALRRMLTIREFDTKAGNYFADGEIPGFVHLYIGEEAVGVGACAALEPDVDSGMLGANGIVGAGPPMATGAALTIDYQDRDQVALGFLGDGAVAQGQVHEAVNMASAWDLPAIFLIENNQYGEATPVEKQHNVDNLSDTAQAYDIPGVTVDGMDVTAVAEAVGEARKRARAGDGPTFIEAETYRYRGHYEGDEQPYRDEEEIQRWKDRDAIEAFKNRLIDRGELTEEAFDEMQAEVEQTIADAIDYAQNAPLPDPEEAYDDMFGEPVPEIEEFARLARTDGGDR